MPARHTTHIEISIAFSLLHKYYDGMRILRNFLACCRETMMCAGTKRAKNLIVLAPPAPEHFFAEQHFLAIFLQWPIYIYDMVKRRFIHTIMRWQPLRH